MTGKLVLMIEFNAAFMSGVAWYSGQHLRLLKTVSKRAAQNVAGSKFEVRAVWAEPREFGPDEMFNIFPRLYQSKEEWAEVPWAQLKKYGVQAPTKLERNVEAAIRKAVKNAGNGVA